MWNPATRAALRFTDVTRPTKYQHLIGALRIGESFYLDAPRARFDRELSSCALRLGIKLSTANLIAVDSATVTAQHILKITRIA